MYTPYDVKQSPEVKATIFFPSKRHKHTLHYTHDKRRKMGYGRTDELNEPLYCDEEVMDLPVIDTLNHNHFWGAANKKSNDMALKAREKAIQQCHKRGGHVNNGKSVL